jgi:Cu/Ag efflux protein CusF
MTHHGAEVRRTLAASLLTALILAVGDAAAQSQQPTSSRPGASASSAAVSTVEGTVRKVDPMGGKVEVSSGLFGLFGTTLQVRPETQIPVEGRQSSLADLREGDKVKASYETREGQSIAKSIQVTPAPEPPRASPRPPTSPGGIPATSQ